MKKWFSMLIVLTMILTLLAGCGATTNGGPSSTDTTPPEHAGDSMSKGDDVETDVTKSAVVDVINVGISVDPQDFSPWTNNSGKTKCLNGIYQSLGVITTSGEEIGMLAESWTHAEDGLSTSFVLRDGIYDSLGNQLTASDVKFNFTYAVQQGYLTGFAYLDHFEITDPLHFTIHYNRPLRVGEFSTILKTFLVTEESYTDMGDEMMLKPVGTGPYKLESYTAGYMFTYTARDDFWMTNEQKTPLDYANVNTINYYIIAEATQRTTALKTGTIDICAEISSDDMYLVEENGELSDKYWVSYGYDNLSVHLFPNCSEDNILGKDENLRKAIYYAINNDAIVSAVFGGNAKAKYDIAPEWVVGFDPGWVNEDTYYQYDMDKAADYLANSSYNGEELKIMVQNAGTDQATAELIHSMLLSLGLNVKLNIVDSAILNATMKDPTEWDILVVRNAADTYFQLAYSYFNIDSWSGKSMNFVDDPTLVELYNNMMKADYTQYDIDTFRDYFVEHAYGYSIANWANGYVVPQNLANIVMSPKKNIMVGCCTYVAE